MGPSRGPSPCPVEPHGSRLGPSRGMAREGLIGVWGPWGLLAGKNEVNSEVNSVANSVVNSAVNFKVNFEVNSVVNFVVNSVVNFELNFLVNLFW